MMKTKNQLEEKQEEEIEKVKPRDKKPSFLNSSMCY